MNNWRDEIEKLADEIESVARSYIDSVQDIDYNSLMQLAWDLKQVARRRTPSEGV